MFEVAMWGQINDSNLASAMGQSFSNSPSWGSAGGRSTAVPTYYYEFEPGKDMRRDVTLAEYQVKNDVTNTINVKQGSSSINFNIAKFRKSWTAFNGTVTGTYGVNWPIIRYADVLLMYAETANELGFSGAFTPLAALQLVQRRAYGANPIPTTPTDHDGFFNALVHERLLEFGGEGIRKYDLIRWNLLATKIAETRHKIGLFAMNSTATDPDTGLPNPYYNYPTYVYTIATPYTNTDLNTEAASLGYYGGPSSFVLFTPRVTTVTPAGYTGPVYWRAEAGTWTNGVLSATYLQDPNTGYVSKFQANKTELIPYPAQVLTENRGSIVQNFGYN
jgi:hypothetical protein